MLRLDNISKKFEIRDGLYQQVLKDFNVSLPSTGFVSILGNSGNGKTTLLNIIGGLIHPDSGTVHFQDKEIKNYEAFRRNSVGYVFQDYNLINHLNAVDNVMVSMSDDIENKKEEAIRILTDLGLGDGLHKYPKQLSGGMQQRVAIARMIAKDVDIIICDEPTGSLDEATEKVIIDLIKELSKSKLVLFVTHNKKVAYKYSDRILTIKNGNIVEDEVKAETVDLDVEKKKVSFKSNVFWLAVRNLFGRKKYTFKYLTLMTFIFLVASFSIILEGEFFKKYIHEELVNTGIKNSFVYMDEVVDPEGLMAFDTIDYATEYYDTNIEIGTLGSIMSLRVLPVRIENITDNQYMLDRIVVGRAPEEPHEVVMTAEGAIQLLSGLGYGGQRLYDQFKTGALSDDYVMRIVGYRDFYVFEYGQPLIKIVGLINSESIYETRQTIYFTDGFLDLYEREEGYDISRLKIYKSDLYQETHQETLDSLSGITALRPVEMFNEEIEETYETLESFLDLSKLALQVILGIGSISFITLMYTSLFERKYEVGLYRSMGYRKLSIMKVLGYEMLLTGMTSVGLIIVGLLAGTGYIYNNTLYFDSYGELILKVNALGIVGILILFVAVLIGFVIFTGNLLILRKTVIENIKDL